MIGVWARRAGVKPQDFAVIVLKRHGEEVAKALGVWRPGDVLPDAVTFGTEQNDV